ncbi:MAG: diaminopimelate epimerase [Chitinophagaceae bacterium]
MQFHKYQGTGNDFVIIDNREGSIQLSNDQVAFLCNRKFGIGADGLMLLQNKAGYDFEMVYYNSDGKPSTMCGNGGRCLVKYAYEVAGFNKKEYHLLATDGPHKANIDLDGWVNLRMIDVSLIQNDGNDSVLNTGSPHLVKIVDDVANYDVVRVGKLIRYSEKYAQEGINVNFVERLSDDHIYVRTYERGVENETLSCGTGVTASALVMWHNDRGFNRVEVTTPGGNLAVEFDRTDEYSFNNIWLCGPAIQVFAGTIQLNK